jgi:copper resistance protein C
MISRFMTMAAAVLLAITGSAALAHTTLQSSTPASGSVLTASPPALTLTFADPLQLTAITLVTASGERNLAFRPGGSARTFSVQRPRFEPGRNEVRWRALSQDGHVMEGSIIIVLRRPAS